MKSRPHDRMQDPYFAMLMFTIERTICTTDRAAKEQGLTLKDSQVQSALTKAIGLLSGKSPRIEQNTPVDNLLSDLIHDVVDAREDVFEHTDTSSEGKPIDAREWILAIEAVIDSIKRRRSGIPGSRDYLDFVQGFIRMGESKAGAIGDVG